MRPRRLLSLAGTFVVLGAARLLASDGKIQASDLPPAVRKAFSDATRGATVKRYAREVDGGQTMFEVETTLNGRARDMLFDAQGALVEIEEATTLRAVPAAVKTALEARGRVLAVERVTRSQAVRYEATIEKAG